MTRASARTLALIAAAMTAVVALAAFVKVMSHEGYRRTATNSLTVPTHAIVPPGQRLCQPVQWVPAETGAVAPWAGGENGAPGGQLTATLTAGGHLLGSGRSQPVYGTGITRIPFDRTLAHDVRGATVCFTNRSHAVVNFYGDVTSSPAQAVRAPSTVDGVPTEIRLDWFTRGVQTHWQELGRIAQRFPLVKAGFLGPWAFWLSCAVLLILSLAAAARIVREAPR